MNRKSFVWSGIVLAGLSGVTSAQEGVWRPVQTHTARYESIDTKGVSLLGKPVTGRKKVDQAIEPASFSADKATVPLPPAPPTRPLEQEVLPFPKTTMSYPSGNLPPTGINSYPAGTIIYPSGKVVYPNTNSASLVPQTTGAPIVNGQVVNGQIVNGAVVDSPVMGNPMMGNPYTSYPISNVDMGTSDRYYRQAIHGSPGIWYGSFDYMAMNLSSDSSPSLLVTGSQTATPGVPPGFTLNSITSIYGGTLPSETLYGGRVNLGVWFDPCQTWGMFGSFFTSIQQSTTFNVQSLDGTTFLGRPFFNTDPSFPDPANPLPANSPLRNTVERVADLGGQGGGVAIDRNLILRSADLNFRFNWWHNVSSNGKLQWNVDGYAGAKYMGLNESMTITENLVTYLPNVGGDNIPVGSTVIVQDQFRTKNNFFGGNMGIITEARLGRFFMEVRAGLALGATQQEVSINGFTQFHVAGLAASQPTPGGLLTQGTNIGNYSKTAFSFAPDFGVKLGLQLTDHLRIFAGYDLMYWTNIVRPGQQIDPNVNGSQFPSVNGTTGVVTPGTLNGSATPAFNFNNSNLLINGLNAGLSWVF